MYRCSPNLSKKFINDPHLYEWVEDIPSICHLEGLDFSRPRACRLTLPGRYQTTPTALKFFHCFPSTKLERFADHVEVVETKPA